MPYVEILRLRKALTWYAGVAGVFVLIAIFAGGNMRVTTDGSSPGGPVAIPWGILVGIAGYCAMIFATVIAPSLNKENDGVEMVWTKPVARERIAASYVLADLAGIVAANLIALVAIVLSIALHFSIQHSQLAFEFTYDSKTLGVAVLALGIAFMWYGLLQVTTCWYIGRAGLVVGLSWGAFSILAGLSHLPPGALHSLVMALNIFNPLAYLSSLNSVMGGGAYSAASVFPLEIGQRVAIVWSIAILSSVAAIFTWKRLEV